MGSGNDIQAVNRLIKQFDDTRKIMKTMTTQGKAGMAKMMKRR
jgi:signal recognition particle subunit SRP54